jgi:pimeloyl-ACP methyl ester carboxylesterase
VYCHIAPGAGNFDPDPEQTASRQVSLLALDRPGYGSSDPVTGDAWASVDGAADDLAEVLQSRNEAPVGVVGWSAGGRVALALAARRPELVDRVVVIATPAPDEFVPWIPPDRKQGLEAMRGLPPSAVHEQLAAQLSQMLPPNPAREDYLALLGQSPADERALAFPGAPDRLERMLRAAFAQGVVGLAADIAGYTLRHWGFQPAEVQAETLLLYGDQDPVAGAPHGVWYQQNLPRARMEVVPGAGHLLVIPAWRQALAHLVPGGG